MLKQRQEQVQFFVRLTDILICGLAFLVAYWLRSNPVFFPGGIGKFEDIAWMLGASITIHFFLYPSLGFYTSLRMRSYPEIVQMVLKAVLMEAMILGTLVFLLQAKFTSRYFFGFFLLLNYSLIAIERIGAKIALSSLRKRGYNFRQVLIVGKGENAARLSAALEQNKHWGYVIADRVNPDVDLESIIRSRTIDEVYFATDVLDPREMTDQVALCESLGIPARLSMSLFDLPRSQVTFSLLERVPVLTFYTTLMTPAQAFIKRAMDIVIALVGLAITVVLYPWISWGIRRESPGPVIFKQMRVGENGRLFKCYKFRTMGLDAESKKQELLERNQLEGPVFKLENDPRVTKFGAFLRKTSLDELPQFLNILRGDMSVVGTRPPTPDEVKQYSNQYRRRLSIRPGLTGLWQVSGRNRVRRFEEILALDLEYIDRWSIWLDLKIIARTVWVAFFGKGAH